MPSVSGGAIGGPFRRKEQPEGDVTAPSQLSHLDDRGRARIVDVGDKADTDREAVAKGRIVMQPETLELLRSGQAAKGDVLAVARIAGIMAAKRTPDLIPLTHGIMITSIVVEFEMDAKASVVEIRATARTKGKTGVEMEALTAVAVAGLTIYDMLKAVDRGMRIEAVRLVKKSGCKSGEWVGE